MKNISIKSVLAEAQEVFMKAPWHWVFVSIIQFLILIACIPLIAFFSAAITVTFGSSMPWFIEHVFPTIISLLFVTVVWAVMLNFYRMAQAALAGTNPEIKDIFHPDTRITPFVLTVFLVAFITYVGVWILVIPGMIAAIVLFLADVSCVEEHTSPVDSLYRSLELVRKDVWSVILFMIISIALSFVAIIPFGLGLLFYVPFMMIAKIVLFRHLRNFEPAVVA